MDNRVTGLLGLCVMAVFALGLAYSIGALPFVIIVLVVLGFAAFDFIQSSRSASNAKNG